MSNRRGVSTEEFRLGPSPSALRAPPSYDGGGKLRRTYIGCGTITIHDTPNLSATQPKRGEKNVLPIGIWIWPWLASASKALSASASVATSRASEKP